jgi:hypothetical protein
MTREKRTMGQPYSELMRKLVYYALEKLRVVRKSSHLWRDTKSRLSMRYKVSINIFSLLKDSNIAKHPHPERTP